MMTTMLSNVTNTKTRKGKHGWAFFRDSRQQQML